MEKFCFKVGHGSIKKIYVLFVAILFFASAIPVINNHFNENSFLITQASGSTLYVDGNAGGDNYSSIQDAINASSDGDTILINRTSWQETGITVNKSVTIKNGTGVTFILDCMGGNGFNIVVNNVTIQNITINNASGGWGVRVYNTTVTSTVLEGVVLDNITVNNSQIGIIFDNATQCNVTYCNVYNSSFCGISLGYKQWLLSNYSHCSYINISHCTISQTIHGRSGPGIEMYNSSYCRISNSTIYNMSYDGGPLSTGVELVLSDFNTITDNNMSSCDLGGIYLYLSDNNTIRSNELYNNTETADQPRPEDIKAGIICQGSSNNTIFENNVSYSEYGISLTTFQGNSSENNTVYLNNIFNNTIQNGFDNCSNNNWNDSTYGNYWDSYNWYTEGAYDNSTDGIFDSPYNIPGGSGVDNYPLRVMWDGNSLPNGTSSIYGYVNTSGNNFGIYNATVRLYHNQTNLFIETQTNITGYFNFSNLPTSIYDYRLHTFKAGMVDSMRDSATIDSDPVHRCVAFDSGYEEGLDNFLSEYESTVSPSYIMNNTEQKFNFSLVMGGGEAIYLDSLNITLPADFTYERENGSSISSSEYTVVNTSNKIFWNATSPGGFQISSTNYFWFNASSNASIGSASFTISAKNHYANTAQQLTITVYTTSSFYYTGMIYNKTGSPIEGAVAEVVVSAMGGDSPAAIGTFTADSNETGVFNITGIPICQNYTELLASGGSSSGQSLFFYQIAAYEYKDSSNTLAINTSRTLPSLPASELVSYLSSPEFYLIPAISFNITTVGLNYNNWPPTWGSKNFSLMIKDQDLGYSVKEFDTSSTYHSFSVPAGRNYSMSIYPNEAFPMSVRFNDIMESCQNAQGTYNIFGGMDGVNTSCMAYNGTYLVNATVNTSSAYRNLTGNFTGISRGLDSMKIAVYNMETEDVAFEEWTMPYNLGYMEQPYWNDTYNLTAKNFTITLPATMAQSYLMLRAYAHNETSGVYYMGTSFISASDQNLSVNSLNFTMQPLINGSTRSITASNLTNNWNSETLINTTAVCFKLVAENGTFLDTLNVFVDITREREDGTEYKTMVDGTNGMFNVSLVNGSNINKIQIYSQQYASISAPISAEILNGTATNDFFNCTNGVCNITMRQFGDFDPLNESNDLSMNMYISNQSCNIPNPPSSYALFDQGQNQTEFSPLNAILKGDINMMISTTNVSIYYINVDLLASGPPDAAFTDEGDEEGFAALWKFGSQGPEIYEYVIVGVNYTGMSFENEDTIRLDFPYLYDNEFNELWNSSKGHNLTHINNWDNLSDYRDFTGAYEAYLDGTGVTASTTDRTLQNGLAYNDETNKTFWFKIPHFSAVGGQIQPDYTPDPPSSFSASSGGTSSVSLSWTKGSKADYTRIQRKTGSYPTSISDGTNVSNNTGTSKTDTTNIDEGTKYYYRAWSFNTTGGTWSSSYVSDTATTDSSSNPSSPDDGDDDPVIPQQTITADAGGTDGTYTGDEDTAITFDASGSSSDYDDIVGYRWDWTNDGTWDTDWLTTATTTHTFADPGTFTVKLEIKDNSSNTDNDTAEVTVNDVDEKPTISSVSHNPTTVTDEDEVTISATVSDNIGISKVELYWNATQSKNMTTSNNETYTATIGTFSEESTIEYYIKAYDTADQNTTSDTYDFTVETVTVDNETSKEIGNMSSNETQEITEEELKGTNLDKVTVKSNKNLSDIKITIKKLSTKPTNTDEPTEDDISTDDSEVESVKVYAYMDINLSANQSLSDGDVEITINFKIEKTWLTQNNITKENVVLMRNKNGKWIKLETIVTDENNTHVFFEAVTNGTSTFAIIGSTPKQDTTETGGKDKESSGGIPAIPIVIGVILVIILLIVFLFKSGYLYVEEVTEEDEKTKEEKKKKNTEKEKLLEYYDDSKDPKKKEETKGNKKEKNKK